LCFNLETRREGIGIWGCSKPSRLSKSFRFISLTFGGEVKEFFEKERSSSVFLRHFSRFGL